MEAVAGRRRVFYFLDSLNVGGTETQAVELARRLDPERYEVTLGCLRAQGPLRERLQGSQVSLQEFYPQGGLDSVGGVRELLRLAKFLRRGSFDIVHTHDLWTNLMGVPAAKLARTPVIISSRRDLGHLDWYQGRRRKWLRWIQGMSDVVLANAGPIRDSLITDDGFPARQVRVIHNGVDLRKFSGVADRPLLGAGNGKRIVMVGNMHSDVKGHPWLIEAAVAIVREFPDTTFVLAGDGELRPKFEQQVAALGLQKNFLFLGRRDDVPQVLAACDIAVLPSKAEGLPNAVLEYMSAGLPTVASHVGGNAEIVDDGVNGLLVPSQDAVGLGAAILRLLRDADLTRRLGESGRRFVTENYSFERLLSETDSLYTELLQRKRHLN